MRRSLIVGVGALVSAVVVASAAAFGFTDDSHVLASATVGSPYHAQVRARNGCPPYSFRVSGAALLPAGLTVRADGLIAGTPGASGRSEFWLAVHDACGGDSQRSFSITVYPAPPAAEVGVPFAAMLVATDAPDALNTWSIASGTLPAGLALDPSGVISGTPAVTGSFAVELGVFNPHHLNEPLPSLQLSLAIAPRPSVVSQRVAPARVGRAYRVTLTARGGTAPVRWSVVRGDGNLPSGIRLNSKLGALIGTARKPGTYRFTVSLTDRFRQTATRRLVLVVAAAA